MKVIKTLEEWNDIATLLTAGGYRLSQWQYAADHADGFHAWYWSADRPQVGFMTRVKAVENAMVEYRLKTARE
jgi:hypothetical protein